MESSLPFSDETTGLLPESSVNSRTSLELGQFSSLEEDARILPQRKNPPHVVRSALVLGLLACGIAIRLLSFSSSTTSLHSAPLYWDDETHHAWEDYLVQQHSSSMAAAGSLLGSKSASNLETSSSLNSNLFYFNQSSAFAMLDAEADFFHYQEGWEAQITQALCAVATTAALLNSLRDVGPEFELPMDPIYKPFPWATQADLLGSAVTSPCVVNALGGTLNNADAVYHMGLGLTMVPRLANCFLYSNGYEATGYPAVSSAETSIKAMVLEALGDPTKRVIYNYDRGGIGQTPNMGHGHWSPLGGYHKATDSFLVMDVAKYKHPMVWVSWKDLWSGAHTVDMCAETLALQKIDWSAGFAGIREYLITRCIPGSRGFVVAQPIDGEL
eukprot:CAMPEP_0116101836 /NCGR_PEP_ID=MMETSP0327-20121206/13022_1 /TAXON_ID=44447 /ORGANISM="Pseudo-nitzschia delicatissima, Strain B596" /LENGTH=385 /DNA_ID=CAMNT_0003593823 /DNA_START=171 /DNA_END=1328 /DNA_ORIENTATION=+